MCCVRPLTGGRRWSCTGKESTMSKGKTKVELVKEQSHYLRGTIAGTLQQATPPYAEAHEHVLKIHGLYQQDDRDERKQGNDHMCMVRCMTPGGPTTAEKYLD